MRTTLNTNVCVTGTGASMPDRIVDNVALAEMVTGYDPDDSGPFGEWVDKVSHIHERRFVEPGVRSSDLALGAARQALDAAGLEPSDVGLIVYATFTPSHILPGDHCRLAEELGIPTVPTFQLMAACAGSIYGLGVAYSMIAAGVYEHVLVVGAETISPALNYHDPITCILFGDGAGAAIVSRTDGTGGSGMLPPLLAHEYSAHSIHVGNSNVPVDARSFPDLPLGPGVPLVEQSLIEMEAGPSVLRRAVMHMAACATRCLGYEPRDLKKGNEELRKTLDRAWLVPHQANGRIIEGLTDRLGIHTDRTIRTIYEYGNISAASNLIALDYGVRYGNMERRLDEDGNVAEIVKPSEPRIAKGDLALLPSIGGGYVMGCVGLVL